MRDKKFIEIEKKYQFSQCLLKNPEFYYIKPNSPKYIIIDWNDHLAFLFCTVNSKTTNA